MGQKIDLTQQVQGVLPEANGGAGPNIGQRFADSETPGGATNGSNTTFTLARSPNPALSLLLFLSKTLQIQGTDYTLSGSTITMTVAPSGGTTSFLAWYRYLGFGQTLSFSDGLVFSDGVLVDMPAAVIPLGITDQMPGLTDSHSMVMSPVYFADPMVMYDGLVVAIVLSEDLSDSRAMTDSFSKNFILNLGSSLSDSMTTLLDTYLLELTPVFAQLGDNMYLLDSVLTNLIVEIPESLSDTLSISDNFLFQLPPVLYQFGESMSQKDSLVIGYGEIFVDYMTAVDTVDSLKATLSGSWTQVSGSLAYDGSSGLQVVTTVSAYAEMQRNDVSFGAEQHAQVQVAALNSFSSDCSMGPIINMPVGGASGYFFHVFAFSYRLEKFTAGVSTILKTVSGGTAAVGDILRIENDGQGNITCRKNGTVVLTFKDMTYGAGTIGVGGRGAVAARLINFAGGPSARGPFGLTESILKILSPTLVELADILTLSDSITTLLS